MQRAWSARQSAPPVDAVLERSATAAEGRTSLHHARHSWLEAGLGPAAVQQQAAALRLRQLLHLRRQRALPPGAIGAEEVGRGVAGVGGRVGGRGGGRRAWCGRGRRAGGGGQPVHAEQAALTSRSVEASLSWPAARAALSAWSAAAVDVPRGKKSLWSPGQMAMNLDASGGGMPVPSSIASTLKSVMTPAGPARRRGGQAAGRAAGQPTASQRHHADGGSWPTGWKGIAAEAAQGRRQQQALTCRGRRRPRP